MYKHLGVAVEVSSSPDDVSAARRLIIAGVGAFDPAIRRLRASGLDVSIIEAARRGIPVLGICLGMQLLMDCSAEGAELGLGIVSGEVLRLPDKVDGTRLRVPHMGWNDATLVRESRLTRKLEGTARFYFVHSYYVSCARQSDVLLQTEYGVRFCSALQKGNVFGVQFHPEKSHRYGMQLLHNFAQIS
jgi:glutamine amidotransferase